MKQFIELERYNPFRPPNWREERIAQLLQTEPHGRVTGGADKDIIGAKKFIAAMQQPNPSPKLAYANPGLHWAYQLRTRQDEDAKELVSLIEARILTDADDVDIAKDLDTLPEVIYWYESLYFNVRDKLKAVDWITKHVLIPAHRKSIIKVAPGAAAATMAAPAQTSTPPDDQDHITTTQTQPSPMTPLTLPQPSTYHGRQPCSEPFFDATIKHFAFFGGKFLLDFVLNGFRRGNRMVNVDELGRWLNTHFVDNMKRRSTAASHTFEVNKYNVMQLFDLNVKIMQLEMMAESDAKNRDAATAAVGGLVENMSWGVGEDGAKRVKGTRIEAYDNAAAELRESEMMLMQAGKKMPQLESVKTLRLPAPNAKGS